MQITYTARYYVVPYKPSMLPVSFHLDSMDSIRKFSTCKSFTLGASQTSGMKPSKEFMLDCRYASKGLLSIAHKRVLIVETVRREEVV